MKLLLLMRWQHLLMQKIPNQVVLTFETNELRLTDEQWANVREFLRLMWISRSGSTIPFADILSMLGERLEVLHVL